jgi:DNA-binding FadR family transcriptional regulator
VDVAPRFSGVDKAMPVFLQIATQLIQAIGSGELEVGARLPSETALTEQFGVSRASVREALCSLQFAGYLESRRGSGTIVCSAVPRGAEELADDSLHQPGDIVDLLGARLVVEPETIFLGATDPAPGSLDRLVELAQGMQLAIGQPDLGARTDLGLHLAFARTCRNRFLAQSSEQLISRTESRLWRDIRSRTWKEGRIPQEWVGHHDSIVQAMISGDGHRAAIGIRAHLVSVLDMALASDVLPPADQRRGEQLRVHYAVPEVDTK